MTLEHLDTIIAFVVIITGVSLLITTLTQMVSALLGLRGSNLRWGIKTLLTHIDSDLAVHARTITEKVLHHPLISDSSLSRFNVGLAARWKLASAIRKEELIEILRLLAKPTAGEEAGASVEPWKKTLAQSLEHLDREAAENLLLAAPEIKKALANNPAMTELVLSRMLASTEQVTGRIHQWFDSTMDRVSQRFTLHTRIWTVLFAVLVAFGLQLDAFKTLTQLSTDAELRSRLVASADSLLRKADEILVSSTNGPSIVYVQAMEQLINSHPRELKNLPKPSGFASVAEGQQWLRAQLKATNSTEAAKWATAYATLVPQAPLRAAADNLHSLVTDKMKFQLIPNPYPDPFYSYWFSSWLHFWGILASAALLSLGAPFWFNMLKNLSNLRPVLANKEEKKAEQQTKNQ
ncbi:MAG: hypothetical protein H7X97_11515 [Opitutaceae bacterium]|nr:hypothetical protein [Verrucomicrobiales bacterium]